MIYNDGNVHTEFYKEDVDRKEIAKQFSEGDEQLEKCLLELWNNGIRTTACCRGHYTDEHKSSPYISLEFNYEIYGLINSLYTYMCLPEYKNSISLDFCYNYENNSFSFTIYMDSEQSKQQCLSFISRYLNNHKSEDFSNAVNIASTAKDLLYFACARNLNCRFGVANDKEMKFCYSLPGRLIIFSDNDLQLGNIIDDIKVSGNIPLCPISCDNDSIEKFIDMIYQRKKNHSKKM